MDLHTPFLLHFSLGMSTQKDKEWGVRSQLGSPQRRGTEVTVLRCLWYKAVISRFSLVDRVLTVLLRGRGAQEEMGVKVTSPSGARGTGAPSLLLAAQ